MLRFFGKNQNNVPPIVGALQLYFFLAARRSGKARYAALTSSLAPPTTATAVWRDGGASSVLGGGRSRARKLMGRMQRKL